MTQTAATKLALERDDYVCQYHKHILHHPIFIFDYREGYHPMMAGGHHLAGRARVDKAEMIIALCSECHTRAQSYLIPKVVMFALLSKIVSVDLYHKYREFCKWDDETWRLNLLKIGVENVNGFLQELPS